MAAAKGTRPPGGSRKGRPNKVTRELKDMVLGALQDAGGQAYLASQAQANPGAFLSLIGKILPMQVAGKDSAPITPPAIDASNLSPQEREAMRTLLLKMRPT